MFSSRLHASLRRCSNVGARFSVDRTFRSVVKSTNEKTLLRIVNRDINLYSEKTICYYTKRSLPWIVESQSRLARCSSSESCTPAKEDVFGDIGDRKFEKVEMDEDEKEEEKFVENEARIPRSEKLSPGRYAHLIKSHIKTGDLNSAVEVLELVKKNRDTPTTYMYNLLLRAFAVSGNFKKCRSLYVTMKKRGIKTNAATYTSILNACANYEDKTTAVNYLNDLRQELMEKGVLLNETHYNVMIKAYGRHGHFSEALAVADEMRDKRLPTNEVTFNSLLIGAISDRQTGLKHALKIWHMMFKHGVIPTIRTYNLMLRAMRDNKLGDLKVNEVLINVQPICKISLNDESEPNLLKFPPTVNRLLFTEINVGNDAQDEKKLEKFEKADNHKNNLPAIVNTEKSLVHFEDKILDTRLETIHEKNRLILFGGAGGILELMERDRVVPDTKTLTLLMELVPPSVRCERDILRIAQSKKISLDIDFFNMLMRKRSFRMDYEGAKDVLDDIHRNGLCPDIITWGMLALSCQTLQEARELIKGMKATGHRLNAVIAGTLIHSACRKFRFDYVLEIMENMKYFRIQPNKELYITLDLFQREIERMIKSKKFSRTVKKPKFRSGYEKFKLRYPEWRKEMEIEREEQGKKTPRRHSSHSY